MPCRSMYVDPADMYMIQRSVIRITELHQEQLSRIFQRTGYVRSAVWEKTFLNRLNKLMQSAARASALAVFFCPKHPLSSAGCSRLTSNISGKKRCIMLQYEQRHLFYPQRQRCRRDSIMMKGSTNYGRNDFFTAGI